MLFNFLHALEPRANINKIRNIIDRILIVKFKLGFGSCDCLTEIKTNKITKRRTHMIKKIVPEIWNDIYI